MKSLLRTLLTLVLLVPLTVSINEANAATLLVTVDPNTYSGSGHVTDLTSGLTGTPSGVTFLSSTNCGVFSFAGGGKISFPQTNFGSQFSISAWVKPNSGGTSIQTIISNAGANLSTNGFKAYWNTWNTTDRKMLLENGNGSVGAATLSSSAVVTNSEWQHLVFTFNTSTRVVTMYRNGASVATDGTSLVSNPAPNTNQTWWLGSLGGNSYYLRGDMGIVKIYSTVLSQAEVTADYNSTSARYAATPTCPTPAPPSNSVAPTISGSTTYGSLLTTTNGTWSGNPTNYAYQWRRASSASGTYSDISGANSQTYSLTSADIGYYLKVNVTATNAGGSSSELSSATSQIGKSSQSLLSATLSTNSKTYPYSQSLTITSSGGSGTGTVTYAVAAGGSASGCSLSSESSPTTISASSSGTCLIRATKAGDSNYLEAVSSSLTFTFIKANPGALIITTTSGRYGEVLTLATAGNESTAADTFTVNSGPCTVSGNSLTPTAFGSCYVTAYRAADGNYAASSSTSTLITIAKATALLSYSISSPPAFRKLSTVSATVSTAGKLKFLMNGKPIPGCQSRLANAGNSFIATCPWKPSVRNFVQISILFTPSNSNYFSGRIDGPSYLIAGRSGLR